MTELTDAEIDQALGHGRDMRKREPRAAAVRYDLESRRLVVDLTNGCTFGFPVNLAQGLEAATEQQLSEVEILGAGSGLHWDALDADLSVPDLAAGLF